MTWRAFFLGLALAALLNWSDVANGQARLLGSMTEGNFPTACVFALVVLTLGVNTLIKLVRKSAAFKQVELMLVWCMLLVASTVPTSGLQRFWLPMLAAPSYLAQRPDIAWRETALEAMDDGLVVTKNPKSFAVRQFYEGGRTEGRLPWREWITPLTHWGAFFVVFYAGVLFTCALLRKQWVDQERLQFPLARVPLEFSEGSAGDGWLPGIFSNRAFVVGLGGAALFRLVRALPLLFGATSGWGITLPLQTVFAGTALEKMYFVNVNLSWMALGFAYLVPVDVSLSIWFFYFLSRVELGISAWTGSSLRAGSNWSQLLSWQMSGAYVAFTAGALFMCRRHFGDVLRRAFGRGGGVDDSREPVALNVAFWGFVVCAVLSIAWLAAHQMRLVTAVVWFAVLMIVQVVHARLVAQSGYPNAWLSWDPTDLLHGITAGHMFGHPGVVLAHMQRRMMYSIPHGPAMMHCMRISEVFTKGRRLLAPILTLVLLVSLVVSTWTYLDRAYNVGVVNFSDARWSALKNVHDGLGSAHQKIRGAGGVDFAAVPFGLGLGLTAATMFMRARFYWWPLHPIGLMACSGWYPNRFWLPFLIGWFIKVCISKYAGGRMLRQGRFFFIGLILAEGSLSGLSTLTRTLSGGAVPGF